MPLHAPVQRFVSKKIISMFEMQDHRLRIARFYRLRVGSHPRIQIGPAALDEKNQCPRIPLRRMSSRHHEQHGQ